MSTLKTISIQHLNGSNTNINLDSSGNMTVTGSAGINNIANTVPFYVKGNTTSSWNSSSIYSYDVGPGGITYALGTRAGSFSISDETNGYQRWKIDNSGRVNAPYQPMFFAQHNGSNQASSRYGYFSGEWINQGGHATHGTFDQGYMHTRFTCPVAGKYLVWVGNIGYSTGSTQRTYVHKNGSIASPELRTAQTGNHGTSASMTTIINASANDYIGCYSYADDASLGFYSGVYSHMGVYLLG